MNTLYNDENIIVLQITIYTTLFVTASGKFVFLTFDVLKECICFYLNYSQYNYCRLKRNLGLLSALVKWYKQGSKGPYPLLPPLAPPTFKTQMDIR
jgi:hypothetical protein